MKVVDPLLSHDRVRPRLQGPDKHMKSRPHDTSSEHMIVNPWRSDPGSASAECIGSSSVLRAGMHAAFRGMDLRHVNVTS